MSVKGFRMKEGMVRPHEEKSYSTCWAVLCDSLPSATPVLRKAWAASEELIAMRLRKGQTEVIIARERGHSSGSISPYLNRSKKAPSRRISDPHDQLHHVP